MLGFTVKVVENAGSSLGSVLSNKNPWAGQVWQTTKSKMCIHLVTKVHFVTIYAVYAVKSSFLQANITMVVKFSIYEVLQAYLLQLGYYASSSISYLFFIETFPKKRLCIFKCSLDAMTYF